MYDTLDRCRTNDRQLRYKRLPHDILTDTPGISSWHRKKFYAHIFSTMFCWVNFFEMWKKSDVHEGPSLLTSRDGIPIAKVMDNACEQTMGIFIKLARKLRFHIKKVYPYLPWQNAAEVAIQVFKRGVGRIMSSSGAPIDAMGSLP